MTELTLPNGYYRDENTWTYCGSARARSPRGLGRGRGRPLADHEHHAHELSGVGRVRGGDQPRRVDRCVHHNFAGWSAAQDGGVLEGVLRLDEEGTILPVEQIEELDAAYARKLKALHKQRETNERRRFAAERNAARRKP